MTELLVHNREEVNTLLMQYELLLQKVGEFVTDDDFSGSTLELDGDYIYIHGEYRCCGSTEPESYRFPVSWLFLSDEELVVAKEEERRKEEEAARQEKLRLSKQEEDKERAELARLKAKYEVQG